MRWSVVCISDDVSVFQISQEDILNIAHLCDQVSHVGRGRGGGGGGGGGEERRDGTGGDKV